MTPPPVPERPVSTKNGFPNTTGLDVMTIRSESRIFGVMNVRSVPTVGVGKEMATPMLEELVYSAALAPASVTVTSQPASQCSTRWDNQSSTDCLQALR